MIAKVIIGTALVVSALAATLYALTLWVVIKYESEQR